MKDTGSDCSEWRYVDVPKQLERTDIHVTVVEVMREEPEQQHGCKLLVKLSTGEQGWLHDSQMSWYPSSRDAFDEWYQRMESINKRIKLLTDGSKKKKAKRRASEEEADGAWPKRPKRPKRPSRKALSTRVCEQKDPSGSSEDSSEVNGCADGLEEAEADATDHSLDAMKAPSGSESSGDANGWADELEEAEEDATDHQIEAEDSPSGSESSGDANGAADELEEAEEDATDHSLDSMDSPSGSESSSDANAAADELEEAKEDAQEHQVSEAVDSPSTAVGEGVDQDEPTDQFASSLGPADREDGDEDMEFHHAEATETEGTAMHLHCYLWLP
ncbi:hypothetical protein AB1Y20_023545 [Prymnesium parvum]|uniref:Uncharacterized protein n=1 Tax=Prymnesium parvum TaxID=97485 RepID=A0AB34JEJ8_PRYPA